MSLDYSAVPRMPDGRTALETIEAVAATSQAVKVPMGPRSAGGNGQQMWHVWSEGSGKPALLLFHGGSGSWIHWIRNVLPLSQHFTVYAADAPGLGDSDPPDDVRDIWSVTHCVDHAVRVLLPTMAPQVLADEARRNLELLMLHDPKNVDGVAIYMQIMNTTRAKTRSRDMGRAYKLSEVLPRVKTPLSGIWGEFDSTTYPHIQERIDLFCALQPDFQMNVIEGAGHWVAYEAAEAFNKKLIEVLE